MNRIGLFNKTSIAALKQLMDLGAERQRAHAKNLANAETPGYTRKVARFADELDRAKSSSVRVATTDPRHMRAAPKEVREIVVYEEPNEDGSTGIDVEEEIVDLAANQMKFTMATRLATLKIAGLRASIQGRS